MHYLLHGVLALIILFSTNLWSCPSVLEKQQHNASECNVEGMHTLANVLAKGGGVFQKYPWGFMVKANDTWENKGFSFVMIHQKINEKKLSLILKQARSFFKNKTYVVWVDKTNKHLEEEFIKLNYEHIFALPGKYLDIPSSPPLFPSDVTVKRAMSTEDGQNWATITAQVYGLDVDKLYAFFKSTVNDERARFYVAYFKNKPVSVRMMLLYPHPTRPHEKIATGYFSATSPGDRKKGFASIVLRKALFDAREDGANLFVTQSSSSSRILLDRMRANDENNTYLGFQEKIEIEK